MDFHPAPGVAQFTMTFSTPGGTAQNVFHVHRDDGTNWTLAQLNTMLNVFSNWEQTVGRLQRPSQITCTGILARDLSVQEGLESSIGGNTAGSITGGCAPDNVTVAVKKVTGQAGRSFRGRTYWVGVPLANLIGDTVNGTWLGNVTSALNTLLAQVNATTGYHFCLLRGQYKGAVLNPRQEALINTFTTVDGTIDSQRRRLLGRGR